MTQAHIIFFNAKEEEVDFERVYLELLTNEDLQFIALSPYVQLDLGRDSGHSQTQLEAVQDELPF